MERETIKLLHQEPLTALEELLLAMGVKKNHISLKGDMNDVSRWHSTESGRSEAAVKVQAKRISAVLSVMLCVDCTKKKKLSYTQMFTIYDTTLLFFFCIAIVPAMNHHTDDGPHPPHPFLSNSRINIV